MRSLTSRPAVILAGILVFSLLEGRVEAAKYTCTAAEKMSKLGARDSDLVVVNADDGNRECRFSVNGEPAGSPPRDLIRDAFRLLVSNKAPAELEKGNVDWLAVLLLAASSETFIPDELRKQLSVNAGALTRCVAAAEAGKREGFPSFGEGKDTFCRLLVGGGEVGFGPAALRVVLESEASCVVVGVRRLKAANFLFIPVKTSSGIR